MRILYGYCTPMIIITARHSYASAVLRVVILSVCLSVCHGCFVTNSKNLPAIFLYHILITANVHSETGFPSSHQLKPYVASKSRLKLAACCRVSRCWPSCSVLLRYYSTFVLKHCMWYCNTIQSTFLQYTQLQYFCGQIVAQ